MAKGIMYVDDIRVEFDGEPNVLEVRGMGNGGYLRALSALGGDEAAQQRFGKHAAAREVVVVGLQRVKRRIERGG